MFGGLGSPGASYSRKIAGRQLTGATTHSGSGLDITPPDGGSGCQSPLLDDPLQLLAVFDTVNKGHPESPGFVLTSSTGFPDR